MAHLLNANTHAPTLIERLHDMVAGFKAARARRADFDRAYRELRTLSDRELVEFGLYRSDLIELARTEALKVAR